MAIPEKPESNVEKFLAAMLGQEVELPEGNLSRVEQYLKELYEPAYEDGAYTLTATVTDGEVSYDWQSAIGNERLIVECEKAELIADNTWTMNSSLRFDDIIPVIEAGREVVVRFRDDDVDSRTVELRLDSYNDESVVFGRVLPSYISATAMMVEFPASSLDPVTLTYVYGE